MIKLSPIEKFHRYCFFYENKIVILDWDLARFLNISLQDITVAVLQLDKRLRADHVIRFPEKVCEIIFKHRDDISEQNYVPSAIQDVGVLFILNYFKNQESIDLHIALTRYIIGSLKESGTNVWDLLGEV